MVVPTQGFAGRMWQRWMQIHPKKPSDKMGRGKLSDAPKIRLIAGGVGLVGAIVRINGAENGPTMLRLRCKWHGEAIQS
jgi:hypothetical protein